jgi:hypothetical protein
MKARVSAVECPKCALLSWEDIWCKNTCSIFDEDHKITYFSDGTHVNALGSYKVGAYVRRKYDEWMLNHTVVG